MPHRMFFEASYILLHRPIVSPHDIATASGPAAVCLQHSSEATNLAVRFTRTFGEYLRYLPRYCWFVAASFDIVMLDSKIQSVQRLALDRLSLWLNTMTNNLLRAPSMRRSVQHISSRIYEVLARNPYLAQSPTGISILAHLRGQRGMGGGPSPLGAAANEGMGFFELLQNT
ncbi:hypothetical protein BD324DRAFT_87597 [Kockovaella imperatae]|uniref:Uncharacterized protein n=1 Tax=Kockovaella imperatae TaxID=4999 RepID=A0A1Y1UCQ2_9TREE|nr:hypothetical protein BD324DRAFT_87597 [Kockovaella imperatae]ORX35286.1 hypothetical protein BD324DRAFT_87597 [Kockovaella imperatae]